MRLCEEDKPTDTSISQRKRRSILGSENISLAKAAEIENPSMPRPWARMEKTPFDLGAAPLSSYGHWKQSILGGFCAQTSQTTETPFIWKPVTQRWRRNSGWPPDGFKGNNADSCLPLPKAEATSCYSLTVQRWISLRLTRCYFCGWGKRSQRAGGAVWRGSSLSGLMMMEFSKGPLDSDKDASLLRGVYTECSLRQNAWRVLDLAEHIVPPLLSNYCF